MRHIAVSQWSLAEPPPWAAEWCFSCGAYTDLDVYELSCCCSCGQCSHDDRRRLFAVAWLCDYCDRVIESAGLFTHLSAALDARRRLLKHRELEGTTTWRGARFRP